jgi:hypothetical protein
LSKPSTGLVLLLMALYMAEERVRRKQGARSLAGVGPLAQIKPQQQRARLEPIINPKETGA